MFFFYFFFALWFASGLISPAHPPCCALMTSRYAIGVAFYIIGFSTEVATAFNVFRQCNCEVDAAGIDYNATTSCNIVGTYPVVTGHCVKGHLFVSTPGAETPVASFFLF